MSTLQEKLAKLGELMASARIERELGIRVTRRRNGDGVAEYLIEHLDANGKARAVSPTAEWAWKLQSCLYGLANELAENIADLSSAFARERARADAARTESAASLAAQAAAVSEARTDAYEDGFNAARTRLVKQLQEYRADLEKRANGSSSGILPSFGGAASAALVDELRRVDTLAAEMTMMNPHAEVTH